MSTDQRRVDYPPEAPVKIEGRLPSGELSKFPPRFDPDRMVVAEEISPGGVTLRVDDESQPDFWMQIRIPREYLVALLARIEREP